MNRRPRRVLIEALESRRLFAAGVLDATFGADGKVIVDFGNSFDQARAVAVQADGKTLVVGSSSPNLSVNADFAIARLNVDGTLDTTFGTGGIVTTDIAGGADEAVGVVIQGDGRIVVGGYGANGAAGNDFVLVRYDTDGAIDSTFGSAGRVTIDLGGADVASDLTSLADGSLLLVGSTQTNAARNIALAKVNSSGALDGSFGNAGRAVFDLGGDDVIYGAAQDSGGNIVVAGSGGTPPGGTVSFVARLTAAGALDTTFSTDGVAPIDFAGGPDELRDVAVDSADRIVAVGTVGTGFTGALLERVGDYVVARLTTQGGLDPSFGVGGITVTNFGNNAERAYAVDLDAQGRVIVAGASGDPDAPALAEGSFNSNFAVLRYTDAGTLDTSFGQGGQVLSDLVALFDEGRAVTRTSDGRIVVAGQAGNTAPTRGGSDFGIIRLTETDTPFVSVTPTSGVEGGSATFNIVLSSTSADTVTVNYATADGTAVNGDDYVGEAGTVTFAPGQTVAQVSISLRTDSVVDGGETFSLSLSSPTNAAISTGTAAATITDLPVNGPLPAQISISDATAPEPATLAESNGATFTVTLAAASTEVVSVNYASFNGTALANFDYTPVAGTLTFQPGETSRTVTVPVLFDADAEASETFTVVLSSPTGGTLVDGVGAGTITDTTVTPLPGVSVGNITVAEPVSGAGQAVFTITLSSAPATAVTVNYATADGTAQAGSDYTQTNGVVTFAAGETIKTVTVDVLGDSAAEESETFSLVLTGASGATLGTAQATATLTNTDPSAVPSLSIGDVTVSEPLSGQANASFTVTLSSAATTPVTVEVFTTAGTAAAGSDYTTTVTTLTIPAGQTTATANVPILADSTAEPAETFTVGLRNATGATISDAEATATISDATPVILTFGGREEARFTDASGDTVRVFLRGAGQGQVFLTSASGVDADSIVVTGTNSRSRLFVRTIERGGLTRFRGVTVNGDIRDIRLDSASVDGSGITVTGSASSIVVDSIANSTITSNTLRSFTARGGVNDSSLSTTSAMSSIVVGNWFDTADDDSVSAASIRRIVSRSDWMADVTTADRIDAVSVSNTLTRASLSAVNRIIRLSAGNITNSSFAAGRIDYLTSSGAFSSNTVDSGGFLRRVLASGNIEQSVITADDRAALVYSRGSIANSTVAAGNRLDRLQANGDLTNTVVDGGSLLVRMIVRGNTDDTTVRVRDRLVSADLNNVSDSALFVGVNPSTSAAVLPGAATDFANTASRLDTLRVRGGFSNTRVAAGLVRTAVIGSMTQTNNAGNPFGIAADQIVSARASTATQTLSVRRVDQPSQGLSEADFVIRVI